MIQMQSSVKRDFIEINFRYIKTTWKNIREGGVEFIDGKLLIYSNFELISKYKEVISISAIIHI